jgi:hypothetical protein
MAMIFNIFKKLWRLKASKKNSVLNFKILMSLFGNKFGNKKKLINNSFLCKFYPQASFVSSVSNILSLQQILFVDLAPLQLVYFAIFGYNYCMGLHMHLKTKLL